MSSPEIESSCWPLMAFHAGTIAAVRSAWPAASAAFAMSTPIPAAGAGDQPNPLVSHLVLPLRVVGSVSCCAWSRAQEHLDRSPLVHRVVALGGLRER